MSMAGWLLVLRMSEDVACSNPSHACSFLFCGIRQKKGVDGPSPSCRCRWVLMAQFRNYPICRNHCRLLHGGCDYVSPSASPGFGLAEGRANWTGPLARDATASLSCFFLTFSVFFLLFLVIVLYFKKV